MSEARDTEITLGTGKLLVFFFGLVAVCAVFFGLGYKLGRSVDTAPVPDPIAEATHVPVAANATGTKPTAAHVAEQAPAAPCDPKSQNADVTNCKSDSDELAFFGSKDDDKKDTPAAANNAAPAQDTSAKPAPELAKTPPSAAAAPVTGTPAPSGAFVVQVAAVTHREDAEALKAALSKKNYPVFVVTDAPDHLFHVQVGPFGTRTDATATRDRLSGDGYSPIVK